MTENKPIIRHGINVCDCEYITHKNSFNPMCGDTGICCYGKKDCYFKQLSRKTQECEELKKKNSILEDEYKILEDNLDSRTRDFEDIIEGHKQTLAEIKPILKLYAISKVGEVQPDGTYKITGKDPKVLGGNYITFYDPRPAKQALQKISEVEND